MLFYWLKVIHVISASVLFGTGLGTAFYMFYVNVKPSRSIELIAVATKQVVLADWLFTGTSGVVQALTGFAMVYLKGYALTALWVWGSIAGYLIAGACWLPVVWLQIRCRDLAYETLSTRKPNLPPLYFRYFKTWWILGIPAFLSLMVVFYLMANRPQ